MLKLTVLWAVLLCSHFSSAQNYPYPPQATSETCSFAADNDNLRLDCHPEGGSTEQRCVERGCCWRQTTDGHPFCYYPQDFGAFEAVNQSYLVRKYRSQFLNDINLLRLDISADDHLMFKLVDAENERFVPPYPRLNQVKTNKKIPYDVDLHKDGYLMKVSKANEIMFSVENASIVYADQFLQLTFNLAGTTLYGVGEHRTRLVLSDNWTRYALWNHDGVPRDNVNLYGSHPFVLILAEDGTAGGLYLHNSNAMDILIQPGPRVTFRTIGGILEFHYFLGSSPADVVQQYHQLIGLPAIPPYWALGFQLCRFGYNSANATRAVWQRMRDAQIPYDVQWNDIDYMQDHNIFTISQSTYAELPQFVEDLHAVGMHYVAMLDPGLSGSEPEGTYPPYSDGVAMDTLLKDDKGDIFIGHVWNRADTVFPDFTHPRALEYWTKQLSEFRGKLKYDALWLDMNEPSNFMDGTANGCPNSNLETPPYVPAVIGGKLFASTVCMTAQHAAGRHYDLHNLFGITETDITLRAAEDVLKKRTFLISRASSAGLGRYSGHWAGDNYSDWPEMVASVVELLTFSIYGVPLMGSDICGFRNEANRELCNRWTQLGAFYPFSRNHNDQGNKDQDPASFDGEFIESTKKALNVRYSLLPYLYTLFYQAQISGTTVARPLFFEFPDDKVARQVDRAFLWGSGLYIVPVLEDGATSVVAYLPSARWFDYYTGQEIKQVGNVTLQAPFDTIPLLLKGGNILPSQAPAVTTTLSRKNPFSFIVVPDSDGNASGSLFWDDGESLDTIGKNEIGLLDMALNGNTFKTTVIQWKTSDTPLVTSVKVLGAPDVTSVTVNNQPADFNISNKVLTVQVPSIPLLTPIEITWK